MPVNFGGIVAVVTVVVAIMVWFRTKKIGPVVAALVGGFLIIAATDPSFLNEGANAVKKLFRWAFKQISA